MVKRWKLAIQEFDFDIEHFPGHLNKVADPLSRINMPEEVSEEELNFLCPLMDETRIPNDKYKIISSIHKTQLGHFGVEKTLQLLDKVNQHWPERTLHVKQFIRQCPCCQKMRVLKTPIITHPYTLASYGIMDRVNIDTIGPLPEDEVGNKYIVAIIDCFSRFLELYAVKDTTAIAAATPVIQFAGRYGIPAQVLSDNGSQYANEIMNEIERIFDNQHKFIHPYSHEENGIIERANKEIMRHLRAIIFDTRLVANWSTYLPLVQRIMNSQVHESIGVSPASIVFGNSLTLDRGILLPYKTNEMTKLSQWTSKMLEAQEIIVATAIATQNKKDLFHIASHSGSAPITEFPINSYVLVKYENDEHRPPTKFHTKLRGPLRVVSKNDKNIYTCENLVTNKLEAFHIKLLSPFLYDPNVTNPTDVANRDNQNFNVKHIVRHRFKVRGSKKSSNLEFFTTWEDNDQTWESFHNLRSNLHKYSTDNRLSSYIPAQ
jgi:hypothetical protein